MIFKNHGIFPANKRKYFAAVTKIGVLNCKDHPQPPPLLPAYSPPTPPPTPPHPPPTSLYSSPQHLPLLGPINQVFPACRPWLVFTTNKPSLATLLRGINTSLATWSGAPLPHWQLAQGHQHLTGNLLRGTNTSLATCSGAPIPHWQLAQGHHYLIGNLLRGTNTSLATCSGTPILRSQGHHHLNDNFAQG